MTDILLFAAGLGTRMRPLTDHLPKPLVPVGDTTLFDHAYDLTQHSSVGKRIVNVHYRADQMRAHLAGKSVSISDETDLLRDTGGGLRHVLPLMDSDLVMTMNTDAIWAGQNPIPHLLSAWQDHMTCLLMLVPRNRVQGHLGQGDFIMDDDGRITWGKGPIYTGLQIMRRSAIAPFTEPVFSMHDIWNAALADGGLFGCLYPGSWCDVGQPRSLPLAEALLKAEADV